ncbi:MAG: hypothetical protein QN122_12140 [Armatimonadota bacterium]|nr:hypothetical protein [Armatimonadota bacterium]
MTLIDADGDRWNRDWIRAFRLDWPQDPLPPEVVRQVVERAPYGWLWRELDDRVKEALKIRGDDG